ncbi:hypothetical protein KCP76_08740 [Salmonella enterica subsp. enterica serovar Weltevreden]|nr:hypothetical protein KCP76_08740 [Salmonella enterica subsp. enterica serovar Weltevreden]
MEEALEIANDTQYGSGAGVWSRKRQSGLIRWGAAFRPGAYGPILAITPIRHMPRLRRAKWAVGHRARNS